ncbi:MULTISPECIES: DUF4190 domain-containing protein [unclassified Pseudoclavibacter]|uniref:DUF4190 domain-containing protein n=1 Tax=unclassified Pseudoclavibacter TaxID=2615177 RepID=UPI001BA9A536|nr:DUF4190 domain-containing protein [Pseudoclavibacter sp. Marseille-Q4354]MBS3177148.1 DUF4190 domain-containing protein [Pseudoclavibacter sp. Marseille-Q4354]
MTWSTPEGHGARIPAPNLNERPEDRAADVRQDSLDQRGGGASVPLFSTPDVASSGYDSGFSTGTASSTGYGQGYAGSGQPMPAQHPAYPVAPYTQAPYAGPRPPVAGTLTLSIVALCLSGGSFLVALIPVLQFVWWMVGIAGVVCGFIALRREPRGRALAVTSIVLGFISVFGLLLLIVLALLFFGGIGLLGGLSSY